MVCGGFDARVDPEMAVRLMLAGILLGIVYHRLPVCVGLPIENRESPLGDHQGRPWRSPAGETPARQTPARRSSRAEPSRPHGGRPWRSQVPPRPAPHYAPEAVEKAHPGMVDGRGDQPETPCKGLFTPNNLPRASKSTLLSRSQSAARHTIATNKIQRLTLKTS